MKVNKRIYLLLMASLAAGNLSAQKKQFTIAEATNGMTTTLAPKSVKNPSWQPGTEVLWQSDKKDGKDVWIATDFSTKGKTIQVIEQGEFPEKVNGVPAIKWIDKYRVYFINGQHIILG